MKTQLRMIVLMGALLWMGSLQAKTLDTSETEKGITAKQTVAVEEDFDLERDESGNWFVNGIERLLNGGDPSQPDPIEEDFDLEQDESGNWFDNGMERLLHESETYMAHKKLMGHIDDMLAGIGIERKDGHHVLHFKKHDACTDGKVRMVETDWFNMQFGWANVMNSDKKVQMPAGYENLNFKGNSSSFQLMIVEQAWNMIGDNVRLTYGLGFTWNRYNLESDARLSKDQDGMLVGLVDDNIQYDRNRLNVNYATMPIGLQLQLGNRGSRRVKIGGGLNLGYLLNAKQNIRWENNGEFSAKIKDNFNIEQFRLGYQAQIGYGSFHLYGRYFPNSMFKKDLGPDVNQFSVGILLGSI